MAHIQYTLPARTASPEAFRPCMELPLAPASSHGTASQQDPVDRIVAAEQFSVIWGDCIDE